MPYLRYLGDGQRHVSGYPMADLWVADAAEAARLTATGLFAPADPPAQPDLVAGRGAPAAAEAAAPDAPAEAAAPEVAAAARPGRRGGPAPAAPS
jgi:hypothetical protein